MIPVEFDYKGKHYIGHLSPVSGAGNSQATSFQLYINKGYRGLLHQTEDSPPGLPRPPGPVKYKWRFSSQTGEFEEMVDYLADVIVAWYE
jgi:hypothetical protein